MQSDRRTRIGEHLTTGLVTSFTPTIRARYEWDCITSRGPGLLRSFDITHVERKSDSKKQKVAPMECLYLVWLLSNSISGREYDMPHCSNMSQTYILFCVRSLKENSWCIKNAVSNSHERMWSFTLHTQTEEDCTQHKWLTGDRLGSASLASSVLYFSMTSSACGPAAVNKGFVRSSPAATVSHLGEDSARSRSDKDGKQGQAFKANVRDADYPDWWWRAAASVQEEAITLCSKTNAFSYSGPSGGLQALSAFLVISVTAVNGLLSS